MKNVPIILLGILLTLCRLFAGQESLTLENTEKIPYRVPKLNLTVDIDAVLDEELWKQAVKIDANIEVRPGENIVAPVKTEVLMAYDNHRIYVAFIAYDPEPSKIRAHFCDRDNIWDDDWVIILFDTFNDQRRTYDFGCNPLGIQTEFIETPTGGGGEWDAIWDSHGRITDEGYIVEMAIPFSSLNFPRTETDQVWGFDAVRSYPRSVRHHIGAFPRDRDNNCYMCQSEKLVGFSGVSPGLNIEIAPTFNVIHTDERKDQTSGPFEKKERRYDPGITAQWGITPNLTLSGTLNPDFSNIEADILQLDINNQFAIYYPEKRPFFLESSDFFDTPLNAVHTRTLADPDWGVKLSGKEGRHAVGFYTVQDEITNFLIPGAEGSSSASLKKKSQGSALRYKADVSKSSNIGLLLTDREGSGYHNRMAGIDADFKFTQKDRLMVQYLSTQTAYPDSIISGYDQPNDQFEGNGFHAFYEHDTRDYEIYALHKEIDRDFRADLGFISQANYRYSEFGSSYRWRRDPGSWFTLLSVHGGYDYKRTRQDELLHRAWTFRVEYEGPLQSHGHVYGEIGKDHYNRKNFKKNWLQGCFGLRPMAEVWTHFYWRYGDQVDYANTRQGTRIQLSPSFDVNFGKHLKAEFSHTFERLNIDPGKLYDANISRLKIVYQFNKRMFLRTILQYKDYQRNSSFYKDEVDPETQKLFSQFLFSYKINPQTVFFLGYADNYYGDQQIEFIQTNRTIFTKIGYALTM